MKKLFYLLIVILMLPACRQATADSDRTDIDTTATGFFWSQKNKKNNDKKTSGEGKEYASTGDASLLDIKIPQGITNEKVRYKAFTVYFNKHWRIPNCVAYELTNTQVAMANSRDAEQRSDYNFNRDTRVNGCPDWWEYKNTGYTRGHMVPAMDMRWDKQAMKECFYMTNMCPQEGDLNDGEWRHAEEAVHSWLGKGKCDRLVIFTGPIVSKSPKKTGKNHDIAVPDAFFKVVYAPTQNRAIAFIMDNKKANKSWTNYATTVDEVERRTGIDFLSSLPDDVEQTIESKQKISDWPRYYPSR